jgi:diguanylate cyclase (GGDEF)-like protein
VSIDGAFPRAEAARAAGLRAAFAFPVLVGNDVAAVLEFFCERAADPDDSILRIMAQVGTQLGRVVERTRAEERLVYDAFHDPLTGLPNRVLFMDRLERAVARRRWQTTYLFAVLFVDLDRFKVVNDSLGHQAGDRLLAEVARRLDTCLRREHGPTRPLAPGHRGHDDTLARFGGDEFTILLDDIRDPSDAVRVANRIQAATSEPLEVDGQELVITASVGIALSSAECSDEDLLRNADLAMYRAKASGRGRSLVFSETMHQAAVARLRLESGLRRALERGEFRIHYQPIVALKSRRIVSFEALVRWQHPDHGLLAPGDFLKVAEDTGLIVAIDQWVLEQACRDIRMLERQADCVPDVAVSVNVSALRFAQPDLIRQVADVLADTGLAPHRLRLELTESVAMSDADHASAVLQELRDLGVRISLDDFGTGYSSLSYLRRFPVDTLKIDGSFVSQMQADPESREIVRAILNLARSLNVEVIAEGTETAEQVEGLEGLDCRYGQGFFFFQPVPRDDLAPPLPDPPARLSPAP